MEQTDLLTTKSTEWKITFPLAGVTFVSLLTDSIARQELLKKVHEEGSANYKYILTLDPDNEYEENGCAIRVDAIKGNGSPIDLGYIPKDTLVSFRNRANKRLSFSKKVFDLNKALTEIINKGLKPTIKCSIVGGGTYTYGARLAIVFDEV